MTVGERLAFPVIEVANPHNSNQILRQHDKFDFKMIKALRESIVQNGPTAPFTGEIMTNISDAFLPPFDWYSGSCSPRWRGLLAVEGRIFRAKSRAECSNNF